jgi:hypothetical protein
MQLYLVQHGAAKSEAEDPERGLTEEGSGVPSNNWPTFSHHCNCRLTALSTAESSALVRPRKSWLGGLGLEKGQRKSWASVLKMTSKPCVPDFRRNPRT